MVKQTNKILKCSIHTAVKNAQQKCLSNAVLAIQEANGTLLLLQAAKYFDVSKSILSTRLQSVQNQVLYNHSQQRLTLEEENALAE